MQINKSGLKEPSLKCQILINDKIKFGKLGYKAEDSISKILGDLKKIKIIPEKIKDAQVKYYDQTNKELFHHNLFHDRFDFNAELQLIKMNAPLSEGEVNSVQKKVEEYLNENKRRKLRDAQMSTAYTTVKNLKSIFTLILEENYKDISSLCENQQHRNIFDQYSKKHREMSVLNKIFEQIIDKIIESKLVTLNTLNFWNEFDNEKLKQKLQQKIRRYHYNKQQARLQQNMIQVRMKALINEKYELQKTIQQMKKQVQYKIQQLVQQYQRKNQINNQNIRLKQCQFELIKAKLESQIENYKQVNQKMKDDYQQSKQLMQKEIQTHQAKFKQFTQQNEFRISQLQSSINQLRHQNVLLLSESKSFQNQYDTIKKLWQNQNRQMLQQINCAKYLVNRELKLSEIVLDSNYGKELIKILQQILVIKSFNLLFQYSKPTLIDKFHEKVDLKDNILLIANTTNGRIFGAYSNLPLDPKKRAHSPSHLNSSIKSFLFTVYKNNLEIFPIKPHYDSFNYQSDFIIFGNEEICIDRFSGTVDSLFVKQKANYLHYDDPNKMRYFFLSDDEATSAKLSGYEIYQITTC